MFPPLHIPKGFSRLRLLWLISCCHELIKVSSYLAPPSIYIACSSQLQEWQRPLIWAEPPPPICCENISRADVQDAVNAAICWRTAEVRLCLTPGSVEGFSLGSVQMTSPENKQFPFNSAGKNTSLHCSEEFLLPFHVKTSFRASFIWFPPPALHLYRSWCLLCSTLMFSTPVTLNVFKSLVFRLLIKRIKSDDRFVEYVSEPADIWTVKPLSYIISALLMLLLLILFNSAELTHHNLRLCS